MGLIRLLPRSGAAQPAVEPVDDATPEMPLEEALVEPPVVSEPAHEPEPAEVMTVAPAVQRDDAAHATQGTATHVIVLANQKGGVAKTTTTLNLGVALREMGYRVLLVDLDPQGNLTMSQGLIVTFVDPGGTTIALFAPPAVFGW